MQLADQPQRFSIDPQARDAQVRVAVGDEFPWFDRYSSINLVGLVTAIVRISSEVNPASINFCTNIANPSATGGLIVWPRSVEITVLATPVLRMFAKAVSHGALFV